MKNAWMAGIIMFGVATVGIARAAENGDREICQNLVKSGMPGLFVVAPSESAQRVRGEKLAYRPDDRFYFVASTKDGHTYHAAHEMIWNVRLQTVAKSPQANEAIAWRPPVKTDCSNDQPLDSFDDNSRFVSLQRYYDHHAGNGERRRIDADLQQRFHLRFSISAHRRCQARTDNPDDVGDLRKTYGFEDVSPDEVLVARITTIAPPAVAATKVYSGLTSELARIGAGEPVCFGFSAPLPTRSSLFTQLFTFLRNAEAQNEARMWSPERTTVLIQRIPSTGLIRHTIKWRN
jgi:hypothetical protein